MPVSHLKCFLWHWKWKWSLNDEARCATACTESKNFVAIIGLGINFNFTKILLNFLILTVSTLDSLFYFLCLQQLRLSSSKNKCCEMCGQNAVNNLYKMKYSNNIDWKISLCSYIIFPFPPSFQSLYVHNSLKCVTLFPLIVVTHTEPYKHPRTCILLNT